MESLSHAWAAWLSAAESAARFYAAQGRVTSLGVAVTGLAILAFGRWMYRPAAALLGALVAAVAASGAIAAWAPAVPIGTPMALALAALAGAVAGLLVPGVGAVAGGAIAGLALGRALVEVVPADPDVVRLGGTVAGIVAVLIFWSDLRSVVPTLVGASLATIGLWGSAASSGSGGRWAGLHAIWFALFGVLGVVGFGLERGRSAREGRAKVRAAEASAREEQARKAQEQRERYARYLE